MKETLSSFKRKIKPGVRLMCVLNEYRPELSGTYRRVYGTHENSFTWTGEPKLHETALSWTYWPKAREVVRVSENEITWHLGTGKSADLLTLRIVEEGETK
jgi:hypothetical protein